MLGTGYCGKSTIFKQLRTIYGQGYLDKDRMTYKEHVYAQIIEQMQRIVECYEELKVESPDKYGHLQLSEQGKKSAQYLDDIRPDMDVDDTVAENIQVLWKEPAVKEIFDQKAKLVLDDTSEYFFEEVGRIADRSYIPTDRVCHQLHHIHNCSV